MPSPQRFTILIVEDDPAIARLQQGQLERAGHATRTASSGPEALAALAQHRVDLVLLETRLTGLALLEQFRTAGFNVPAIVVTGCSDEATAIGALRAGVRDFIPKAANYLEQLPAAVDRVLRQVATERRLAESEARLSAIIDSARDAVIVVDSDRLVTLFNAAAERMFGVPAAEALGEPLARFLPVDYQGGRRPRRPGEPEDSLTHRLRSGRQGVRASGAPFPVEISASRSEPGRGTRFDVYLPALESGRAGPAAEAAPPPQQAAGEQVLVVDDEASIREVARAILEANGYRVLTAAHGAEGVAAYSRHRGEVRAVLSDMAMPVMDGLAMARALAELDPGVRIIIASGYAGADVLAP